MAPLGSIDRGADAPVFRQIADALRVEIRENRVLPGEKLPSETELMSLYGVARMTVRGAIDVLRGEGLVVAEHGRGVFARDVPLVRRVVAGADPDAGRGDVDLLETRREKPTARIRELLGIDRRASVVVRTCRYSVDGEPVELVESFVPLASAAPTGRVGDRTVDTVSARMPTPEERRQLQLSAGMPVLVVTRVSHDPTGRAAEVSMSVKSSSRFVLEYTFVQDTAVEG